MEKYENYILDKIFSLETPERKAAFLRSQIAGIDRCSAIGVRSCFFGNQYEQAMDFVASELLSIEAGMYHQYDRANDAGKNVFNASKQVVEHLTNKNPFVFVHCSDEMLGLECKPTEDFKHTGKLYKYANGKYYIQYWTGQTEIVSEVWAKLKKV